MLGLFTTGTTSFLSCAGCGATILHAELHIPTTSGQVLVFWQPVEHGRCAGILTAAADARPVTAVP